MWGGGRGNGEGEIQKTKRVPEEDRYLDGFIPRGPSNTIIHTQILRQQQQQPHNNRKKNSTATTGTPITTHGKTTTHSHASPLPPLPKQRTDTMNTPRNGSETHPRQVASPPPRTHQPPPSHTHLFEHSKVRQVLLPQPVFLRCERLQLGGDAVRASAGAAIARSTFAGGGGAGGTSLVGKTPSITYIGQMRSTILHLDQTLHLSHTARLDIHRSIDASRRGKKPLNSSRDKK